MIELEPGLRLRRVRLADVRPNAWNPNVMSDELAAALNRTMERFGYRQFVLIRPAEEGWEIVDGEHRWKQLLEQHGPGGRVWMLEQDLDERDARLSTIAMNHTRGADDPVRLARLVIALRDEFDVPFDEIERVAGIGRQHLDELERLTMPVEAGSLPPSAVESPVAEVHIALYAGQNEVWERAMEKALRMIEARPNTIVLVGEQVGIYDKAMKKAHRLGETRARSRALELICAAFLAEPEEGYEA